MSTAFSEILAGAGGEPGRRTYVVTEDWHQGRTAYGGFSTALALATAIEAGEDLPPLRSAQVSMIAPVFGEVEVRARQVRRGRNATWMAAEVLREGEVAFTASFVFMGPVASAIHVNDRPVPAELIPVDEAKGFVNDRGPSFLRHNFDVRFALPRNGGLGSEDKRPEMCWWVRARDRAALDPMVELVLCADALPPGVMSLLTPATPVSTMQWQVNLLTPAPATRDGWWLLRSRADYAEAGCSSQRMAIWNDAGTPMLAGMQSVALFG
ncbi:acyl-CoA thioesterase [Novosphingobium sp. JCM 18896]|uniref:acyl-CoA thioesterase n=1 Tax=Novosphingobium sp. JCM 18896 TaxID=2989731 RepID=UPI002221E101|nr:thioesterase family protein [Novosphingobium sp. JCM 18896]MCW1428596.1 thioesterase family protein [Novosphingobium sp. JCM 18896]